MVCGSTLWLTVHLLESYFFHMKSNMCLQVSSFMILFPAYSFLGVWQAFFILSSLSLSVQMVSVSAGITLPKTHESQVSITGIPSIRQGAPPGKLHVLFWLLLRRLRGSVSHTTNHFKEPSVWADTLSSWYFRGASTRLSSYTWFSLQSTFLWQWIS